MFELPDSALWLVFMTGLVSAVSLPLGTLTTVFWQPGERMLAVLMAFGGGALLAALTIDLVGSALEKGHFWPLAAGCILGGILFEMLNQLVNRRGGFLRKSSTLIFHMERRRRARLEHVLDHVARVPLFKDLPESDRHAIAERAVIQDFPQGAAIYEIGDPADELYIVEKGQVEIVPTGQSGDAVRTYADNDSFGRRSFITGLPHREAAVARTSVRLWSIPKATYEHLLQMSPALAETTIDDIASADVRQFLMKHHRLSAKTIDNWVEHAAASVRAGDEIPPAINTDTLNEEFVAAAARIGRVPIFQGLDSDDLKIVSSQLFVTTYHRGDVIFRQGERADRMFIVETGEVSLLDPDSRTRDGIKIKPLDAFGGLSFLAGGRHTMNAVATRRTKVWVLRKSDFEDLVLSLPRLERRLAELMRGSGMVSYLEHKLNFHPNLASRWIEKAIHNLDVKRLVPSIDLAQAELHENRGVPVAIWLGILLDGIPESLVIGASMIDAQISLSLVAGLFFSNYPEALSSSAGMRQQGFSFTQVLIMWTSITLLTGIGAVLGNMFFIGAEPFMFSLVQGIAAGAMLTMIAETMLPEAYFKGGTVVGLSTLAGFLVAIYFNTLNGA